MPPLRTDAEVIAAARAIAESGVVPPDLVAALDAGQARLLREELARLRASRRRAGQRRGATSRRKAR